MIYKTSSPLYAVWFQSLITIYTSFLITSQNRYSGAGLSRVAPHENLCHGSASRFLASSNFTPKSEPA
ncbi:hypothetical protein [Candidatus Jettenia sp. AMX1]|uniref:hypothetical protein n=1 Tax=Candidatus Jettenia sp. AMX1 TaxID=2293637 RepID=UPI0025527E74|nr:hypothetical protein [Candidatus Jettenia sp. AMX1]MDL1940685.1 hypothetical protein [Candidatus Jettenia sp. AMX1]